MTGCGSADLGCQCGGPAQAAVALLAGPCLLTHCNSSDLASFSSLASAACLTYNAGRSTTLPIAAAATTKNPSASTSTALGANIPPDARITAAPQGVLGLGSPPAATSGASQVHDGLRVGMLSPGAQVVIALGGIVSATFGAGVLYFPLWSRRRKRRAAQALADKEAPPVDELAQWIRATGGDEKKRYTVVDLTRKSMGPQELDVPAPVFELPATFLRHEAP